MKFLMYFTFFTLLAAATLASETQAAEKGRACLQANGAFTFDHLSTGKLVDLTQAGLETIRSEVGEPKTSNAPVKECPEPKVSALNILKNWFKQFKNKMNGDPNEEVEDLWTGDPRYNPKHFVKSGTFEASLFMTQDGEKILSNRVRPGDLQSKISVTQSDPVEALLLFRGCDLDEDGKCLVTADYVIEAPDGTIFHQQINTDVWKEPMISKTELFLTNTRMGFLAPGGSDTGTYKIKVSVYDKISGRDLSLTGYVEVNMDAPRNNRGADSGD
jgi:hypothetical protein